MQFFNYILPHEKDWLLLRNEIQRVKCSYDQHSILQYVIFGSVYNAHCTHRSHLNRVCPLNIENSLVIHLRAGDIFHKRNVNKSAEAGISGYRQPPLLVYDKIIRCQNWSNIILISEPVTPDEGQHPIWEYFLNEENRSKYNIPFSFHSSSDFNQDLNYLLCARHFVPAMSTLSSFIIDLNPFLATLFSFQDCSEKGDLKFHCITITIPEYFNFDGDVWRNSPAQRKYILEYNGAVRLDGLS